MSTSFDEEARWLVVRRGHFSIAANLAAEAQAVPLESRGEVVLASAAGTEVARPGGAAPGGGYRHHPPTAFGSGGGPLTSGPEAGRAASVAGHGLAWPVSL